MNKEEERKLSIKTSIVNEMSDLLDQIHEYENKKKLAHNHSILVNGFKCTHPYISSRIAEVYIDEIKTKYKLLEVDLMGILVGEYSTEESEEDNLRAEAGTTKQSSDIKELTEHEM